MAKSFNELRRRMAPDRRLRNAADSARVLLEMTHQDLCQNVTKFSQSGSDGGDPLFVLDAVPESVGDRFNGRG